MAAIPSTVPNALGDNHAERYLKRGRAAMAAFQVEWRGRENEIVYDEDDSGRGARRNGCYSHQDRGD